MADRARLTAALARDHQRLTQYLLARGANAADAQDVAQEAILKAIDRLDSLKDPNKAHAWLKRIALNHWRDRLRRQKSDTIEIRDDDWATEPDDNDSGPDIGGWLMSALDELPPEYREALMSVDIHGQPQTLLAESKGLSLSGARSRVQRGRRMLRERLQACCQITFDKRGNVVDAQSTSGCC